MKQKFLNFQHHWMKFTQGNADLFISRNMLFEIGCSVHSLWRVQLLNHVVSYDGFEGMHQVGYIGTWLEGVLDEFDVFDPLPTPSTFINQILGITGHALDHTPSLLFLLPL